MAMIMVSIQESEIGHRSNGEELPSSGYWPPLHLLVLILLLSSFAIPLPLFAIPSIISDTTTTNTH